MAVSVVYFFQAKKRLNLEAKAYYKSNNRINQEKEKGITYFSGTYIEERDAPIPGVPCLTGLLVMANSPR